MKIIVTDEVAQEGLALLAQDPRVELHVKLGLKKDELLAIIGEYDVIITRSGTTVNRELLDAGKRLRLVARAGVGIDNVDVDYASSRGVIVVNAPFGNTNSAAEHAMALLLSFCRNVTRANGSLKSGEWKRAPFTGYELKGKTAGVIGLGKVGGRVATRLKAFECDVLACDPYIAVKRAHDLGVKLVSHDEIYKNCDIITVHTPLTDETRNMIGERELAMMKDGVIIVNAARGGIIEEAALLKYLESGKVAGAAVDVFSEEPPKSEYLKKLIGHERVVVTPHLGANTFEAQVNVAVDVSREILNYLDDQPLENAVNIPRFDLALMDQMRPFLNLMNTLCEFGIQLLDANISKIVFGYAGSIAHYDCTPLTVCGLASILNRMVDQDVNMVNASLIAVGMGIVVEETKTTHVDAFSNLITVVVEGEGGKRRTISGTLFDGVPRIVRLRDYSMDFAPEEHMLLLHYADRPGMIGKIGTIMGQHEINIASMNLGRSEKKGEAMVILSLDSAVPPQVLDEVRAATDATFIKAIHMPGARCSRSCGCGV
ncbi:MULTISPECIES: phosphoglycerate dehydrogenase [Geobacter]|uniref:D-3-phosphoglycerate dehydrogenase n=2 Tax=Geobacter TaxID=28231 RepID=A0A0C1TTG0_9BACT|nr:MULTISPECIES: phosphoglycerate dehydrogenase [Geobacter]KIE42763.1 3-phosphoglycerate dehydrogenase [Geobacter soli]MBE2888337.1 phosphoglycerate dehydrogenase [Geobacter anodireducens]